MGEDGAQCFYTLSSEERVIPKKQWDEERFGQVCTSAQGIADIKAEIEKLCRQTRTCTYEMKKQITAFFEHIEGFRADASSSTVSKRSF